MKENKLHVTHIIAEFHGCNSEMISRSSVIKRILEKAVSDSNLTKVQSFYHQFSPHGVTGVVLLKESHISIHTWPEFGYAAIDIFGCGDKGKVLKAYHILVNSFRPTRVHKKEVKRGMITDGR